MVSHSRHYTFYYAAASPVAAPAHWQKVKVAHTRLPSVMVPKLIPVRGSQPPGDVSHKPGGRLPLLSARPAVTLATLKRAAIPVLLLGEQRHNGCEQFVTRLRRDCDLNPGPSAPQSSTLTTRLPSHPHWYTLSVSLDI